MNALTNSAGSSAGAHSSRDLETIRREGRQAWREIWLKARRHRPRVDWQAKRGQGEKK